ncbi:MAG: hypothetical protein HKM05_02700 [Spirochaetales bacterium]|nr:hypothetical protein [Spirochaetales bacterium]
MSPAKVDRETYWVTSAIARYRGFEAPEPEPLASLSPSRLFDVASRHKAVAVTQAVLASGVFGSPNELLTETWAQEFYKQAASRRAVQSWILEAGTAVLEEFHREGIRALAVKGPALAIQLWGNPHEREFRDLDILVPVENFESAVKLMLARGFVIPDNKVHQQGFDSWLKRAMKLRHMAFRKKGMPVFIEIHGRSRASLSTAPFGFDEAWETSVLVQGGGFSCRTLEPGRHAVYVLIHGAEHSWCQLHWVLDSLAMLTRFEDKVRTLLARPIPARYTFLDPQATVAVFTALVRRLKLGPVPAYLQELLANHPDANILGIMAERNFANAGLLMSQMGPSRKHRVVFLHGLTRGAYRRFLRSAGDFLLPNDLDIQYLSRWKLPYSAYYFLRPILFAQRKLQVLLGGKPVESHW